MNLQKFIMSNKYLMLSAHMNIEIITLVVFYTQKKKIKKTT